MQSEWFNVKLSFLEYLQIDTDFLAQYQMNYGVPQQEGENEETNKEQQDYTNYYNYYQVNCKSKYIDV